MYFLKLERTKAKVDRTRGEAEYVMCPKCLRENNVQPLHICDRRNKLCWEFVSQAEINLYWREVKNLGIKRKFRSDKEMMIYMDDYLRRNL